MFTLLVASFALSVVLPPATFAAHPGHHPGAVLTQPQIALQGSLMYVSGTIRKGNDGEYILRDASNSGLFWLDDQRLVAKYLGKQVSITGVLDAANNLIRILNIRSAD